MCTCIAVLMPLWEPIDWRRLVANCPMGAMQHLPWGRDLRWNMMSDQPPGVGQVLAAVRRGRREFGRCPASGSGGGRRWMTLHMSQPPRVRYLCGAGWRRSLPLWSSSSCVYSTNVPEFELCAWTDGVVLQDIALAAERLYHTLLLKIVAPDVDKDEDYGYYKRGEEPAYDMWRCVFNRWAADEKRKSGMSRSE